MLHLIDCRTGFVFNTAQVQSVFLHFCGNNTEHMFSLGLIDTIAQLHT